ncbi:MAG: phospholipase D-like domain-containing protein, partial [Elusimicrobiales bacterium]|nr:phospholipase D-like domain-containing protein [Elusimicrobiales bacterium]
QQGASPEVPEGYYGTPPQSPANMITLNGTSVPLYLFSPGSDTENKLAKLIDSAKKSVDAVTFTFSSKPIADAIIRAHNRGVKVRFLEDKDMAKASVMAKMVYDAGVPFRWTGGRNEKGAMHNKFIILDGQVLGTGSFNFTTNASVNSFENIVFTNDETIGNAYASKFGWVYSQAQSPLSSDEFEEIDTNKSIFPSESNSSGEID